ncbi:MAG: GNAT family N-acetyltransferase [Oscillospiraceae bacterium]|jgi:RimJ/RimL family protein N-acetyltransferase|nr:GNAT family N-acetyltransferase [Oscillospiraceae bacterium]
MPDATPATLALRVPAPDDWRYRQKLCLDRDTMTHNAPHGDNVVDGTVYLSEEYLRDWFTRFPASGGYYAYVTLDGQPIGEVSVSPKLGNQVSVTIEARHRGNGYGKAALRLVCDKAFRELGYAYLTDTFEPERTAAERAFADVGFERVDNEYVRLFRERYFALSAG